MKKIIHAGPIAVFVIIAVTIAITGCQTNGPLEKITLAAYEGDTGLLPYIAQEQGFFEENGLDVEIKNYESGKQAADALLAGDADISTSAAAVLVSDSFTNPQLRTLGTISVADKNGLIARKDKMILSAADLVGKKIGVTRKSHGEFALGVFLIFNGLTLNDVKIVDLNPIEIVDAIVSGEIDAGFTWEPNLFNAKTQLGEKILLIKENIPKVNFILLSSKGWVEDNPQSAMRFMKALVEAEKYILLHDEEAKQFMKERFQYESTFAEATWLNHQFSVSLLQELILQFEDIARWRIQNNLTTATKVPNYLDYIYLDALEEVKPEAVTIIR